MNAPMYWKLKGAGVVLSSTPDSSEVMERRVLLTEWGNGPTKISVSTVLIPLASWSPEDLPCFETLVYKEDPGFSDEQDRYTSYAEAVAGHWAMCRELGCPRVPS